MDEVIEALKRAQEMLRIAGPLVEQYAADAIIHYDQADCDGTCIADDCRDAADHIDQVLSTIDGVNH